MCPQYATLLLLDYTNLIFISTYNIDHISHQGNHYQQFIYMIDSPQGLHLAQLTNKMSTGTCSTGCSTSCSAQPVVDENISSSGLCKKCGASPYVVLDKVHIHCRDCFLESCNKKIRSTIGKSKLLRNNDPILIAYSGGPSSVALLSLIKNSIEYNVRREQKFRPSILHIDVSSALGLRSETDRSNRKKNLLSLLRRTHELYPEWPLYWTTLEMTELLSKGFSPLYVQYNPQEDLNSSIYDLYLNNIDASQALEQAIKSQDLTDRLQYIQTCTNELINQVAQDINSASNEPSSSFKFVFKASSATQLANNLLVDVILGEGASIRSAVSICDFKPVVPIVRPMRDFSKKEIAFYLKAKNLDFHVHPNLCTFADRKASIQNLTEAFLSKLYVDYPATYSTLLRTGNKMQD